MIRALPVMRAVKGRGMRARSAANRIVGSLEDLAPKPSRRSGME
jgi:hypothetical protein